MAAAAEELDVDGIAVRLTNPDKMYFPKLGSNGTKRKLVEYYLAVAGGPMLDRAAGPAHPSAALSRRHRRRGDLPEADTRSTIPTTWRPAGSRSRRGGPPTR